MQWLSNVPPPTLLYTRETHHKPTTRKRWINALVFQKTLLPLLRFEKTPCYPTRKHDGENVEKTHRKPKEQNALVIQKTQKNDGENPQKTQGPTRPCYPESLAKWWRKPLEKSTQHMQVHSDHKQMQLAGTSQAWSTGERHGQECWIKYPPAYWIFK